MLVVKIDAVKNLFTARVRAREGLFRFEITKMILIFMSEILRARKRTGPGTKRKLNNPQDKTDTGCQGKPEGIYLHQYNRKLSREDLRPWHDND
jgi:hypothetical protein